jgi:hypothetical protein
VKEHLPAPVMSAPLKVVFPVVSAPSKLAFVKLTCEMERDKKKHEIAVKINSCKMNTKIVMTSETSV